MDQDNYWTTVFKRRVSRRKVIAGGLGLAGATIVGCSTSTTSPTATTGAASSGTTPQAGASPAAASQIQKGGTLRWFLASDAGSLDPHFSVLGWNVSQLYQIYDRLIGMDDAGQPDATRGLAEKWTLSDDRTKITLNLRKGVQFHDGTPFNAQAVKFNFDRIKDPANNSPIASSMTILKEAKVVDDYTIELNYSPAYRSGVLTSLGIAGAGMISSPTAVQKWGKDYGKHPVGTGPFMFESWREGSEVTYKRNPNYWQKDTAGNQLPYLDGQVVSIIPDSTVSFANLQTGALDVAAVQPTDLDTVKSNKNLAVFSYVGVIWQIMVFNTTIPPFDDKNVRLAVCYAVNPDAINKAVYYGQNIVAKGGMESPGHWAYSEFPRIQYDLAKAKDYLSKSKVPQGFSFQMLTYANPQIQQAAEMIQSQLKAINVNAQIEVRENIVANTSFFGDGTFPVFSESWSYVMDPDAHDQAVFKSGAYYNPSKGVINKELDDLVDKASATFDINERKKIITQIDSYVVNEGLYVPQLYSVWNIAYNVKVQNAETFIGPDKNVAPLTRVWIKK